MEVKKMSVEIGPEQKILFWNRELELKWKPRIARARKAYYGAELSATLVGLRKVYVYHVYSEHPDVSFNFLRKNGLVFFPIRRTATYSGFSHSHPQVVAGEPFTIYGVAVKVEDMEVGELFKEYSNAQPTNHRGIGELLGYPKCCLDFFDEYWYKVSVDPMYEAALNTEGAVKTDDGIEVNVHPYSNKLLRYFGLRITPHVTCSMNCEATNKWGEIWFDLMLQVDERGAG